MAEEEWEEGGNVVEGGESDDHGHDRLFLCVLSEPCLIVVNEVKDVLILQMEIC